MHFDAHEDFSNEEEEEDQRRRKRPRRKLSRKKGRGGIRSDFTRNPFPKTTSSSSVSYFFFPLSSREELLDNNGQLEKEEDRRQWRQYCPMSNSETSRPHGDWNFQETAEFCSVKGRKRGRAGILSLVGEIISWKSLLLLNLFIGEYGDIFFR